jgi:hypothetical protein
MPAMRQHANAAQQSAKARLLKRIFAVVVVRA